ncbi:MAG: hypothetical protein ACI3XG_10095, partial [Faecousia sp.]
GPDFVRRLWQDANSHFPEVEHLAKRDEKGNLVGMWGVMTNFSFEFLPWEDNYSKGLYLAGLEVDTDAVAPAGWKKWVVPGFEYWKVKADGPDVFRQTLDRMREQNQPLAAAVQDFTDPATGENYMLFPVAWNDSKQALIRSVKDRTEPVGVCTHHCAFCYMARWCGGCRSACNVCSYATLSQDNVCPNVRCALEKGLHSCAQCPELMECSIGFYHEPNAATPKGTALFVLRYGPEAYTQALSNAIRAGVRYAEDLDDLNDPEKVFALLERFLSE